jgi:hypothetical protein
MWRPKGWWRVRPKHRNSDYPGMCELTHQDLQRPPVRPRQQRIAAGVRQSAISGRISKSGARFTCNLKSPMKTIAAAALFLSSAGWPAESQSPALVQYMAQLQCVTELSFRHISAGLERQGAVIQAAELCIPPQFRAETAGLSPNVIPSTRAERIESLVRSVKFRMYLCARQNLSGSACVAMFGKSDS